MPFLPVAQGFTIDGAEKACLMEFISGGWEMWVDVVMR